MEYLKRDRLNIENVNIYIVIILPDKFNLIEQREKNLLTLRKEKIDEMILSKRLKKMPNFSEDYNYYINCEHLLTREEYDKLDPNLLSIETSFINKLQSNYLNEIDLVFNMLNGNDINMVYSIYLTKVYLSLDFPDIKLLVSKDLFNILKNKLETITNDEILTEIYWIFSNIAFYGSYEEISILLNQDFMRLHSKFLSERLDNLDLIDQVLWTLSNIISDNIDFRNIFLTSTLLDNVINVVNYSLEQSSIKTIKAVVFLLYHCLEKEDIASNDESLLASIYKIFPIFCNLIHIIKDEEVFLHCIYSLKLISGLEDTVNPSHIPYMFIENNGQLIKLLLNYNYDQNTSNLMPTISIFGNLLSCQENEYVDRLLNYDIFNFFEKIFEKEKRKNVKKVTLWAISNIALGANMHQKRLVDSNLFAYITTMTSDYDFCTRKEAIFILYNLCLEANITLSIQLAKKGIFEVFMKIVDDNIDNTIILMALDSIENILHAGILMKDISNVNPLSKNFDEIGGCNFLEQLQKNPDNVIYEKALSILEKYFPTDEVDYENLGLGHSAENSYNNTFSFNDGTNTNINIHGNVQSTNPNYNFFGPNGALDSNNQYLENYPNQINSNY